MKKIEKPFFISLLLSCIPILLYFMFYPLLPSQIPSSFSFSGEVTGYTSRGSYLFLTLLPFFITIVFAVAPRIDPKMQNYDKFLPFYGKFQVFMVVFMDIIIGLTMLQCIFDNVPTVSKVTPILLGCLFIFIGNYLPKTKQTFTFGIKTPWTLSSELVWYKTHRIAGYSFMFAGICSFISALLPAAGYLMLVAILLAVLIPTIMSYVYYKQENQG
ncbi:SdpI family protein [Chakrabartyella piscis]|uniref:SdpI family protein n=1 Tax=Chakrabartyella piscis TaxID=2918914 RepID=UPI002958A449|nr:SdpI family protein [Chakrabartyella piscis]